MASSCSSSQSLLSSWDWKLQILTSGFSSFSGRRQNTRRRRRCIFNKYFTKTGMFLVLGVIILAALPHCALCRPIDNVEAENVSKQFHVYAQPSDGGSSSSLLTSFSESSLDDDEDEVSAAADAEENSSRFEFQRKISSSSSNKPDADNLKKNDNRNNVHSLENSSRNDDNKLVGGNSSMIVHVIITSSSSTSSGSLEFDETDSNSQQDSSSIPEDNFQYTVSDDEDGSLVAEPSSDSHVSTVRSSSSSSVSTTLEKHQDLKMKANDDEKSSSDPQKYVNDGELELKKTPKSQNETPDIFSAFYRAFSQTSLSSPSEVPLHSFSQTAKPAQQDRVSLFSATPTAEGTTTTFHIPPPRTDLRQRPSSFQLFQQRRRLFRNRQSLERKSSTLSPLQPPDKIITDHYNKNVSGTGNTSAEETARKLEFLARKLDKSEQDKGFRGQQDKVLVVSSSSSLSLITTTQVPFLLSQPSSQASSFSPSKIAVSVTHTKSVVASDAAGTSVQPTKQEVVREGVKNNAKSETSLPVPQRQEGEKIHGTFSYFTRPRPLIKSLPRGKDQQNDNINNKSRSNSHIFPKNFSTHGREENGILGGTYGDNTEGSNTTANGTGKSERSSNNNHNDKVNENNFRIQDKFNIVSSSIDGGDSSLPKPPAFSFSNSQNGGFIEVTTFRPHPQRRKITRTVSGEIGDPSSYYFNINVNYRSTSRSPSKAPVLQKTVQQSSHPQTTPKPVVNWQQPEQIWSEPAKVWGVPAKVWGEPERVWSEPARVWSQPESVWAKKLEDEMVQSDQPPEDRKTSDGEDNPQPGTFVILGDDENEGDSIDGDLGRPLMLHHFSVPPNKRKETVSVSTSVTSSVSSNNKTIHNGDSNVKSGPFSRSVAAQLHQQNAIPPSSPHSSRISSSTSSSVIPDNSDSKDSSESSSDQQAQNKKSGKKFGYVIEGANVRKYRVEERTPDGYIVGEYGVLNNQNAFLRGVRYTADGTINPRLIHEALMKFLSLRR